MSAGELPVLTYHAIAAGRSPIATSAAWFAETLAALGEAGYRGVDLAAWVAAGRPPVERGFAVAFDDGLRSILEVVDVLERYAVPATIFLVSGRMGGDNAWPDQPAAIPRAALLSWSEASALRVLGFQFGAHGRTHVALDRCGPAALEAELRGSREEIEDRLGCPCPLLAYPYGRTSPRVRALAARHFDAAFGTRLAEADDCQDRYELARIDAYYVRSRATLQRFVSGRRRPWLRFRRALRGVRSAAVEPLVRYREQFQVSGYVSL
jgi:peptidoglycan/xylan/chitin deacetylase (PgdA/CDA1 family)